MSAPLQYSEHISQLTFLFSCCALLTGLFERSPPGVQEPPPQIPWKRFSAPTCLFSSSLRSVWSRLVNLPVKVPARSSKSWLVEFIHHTNTDLFLQGLLTLLASATLSPKLSISPSGGCLWHVSWQDRETSVFDRIVTFLTAGTQLAFSRLYWSAHTNSLSPVVTTDLVNSIWQLWFARNGMPRIASTLIWLITNISSNFMSHIFMSSFTTP